MTGYRRATFSLALMVVVWGCAAPAPQVLVSVCPIPTQYTPDQETQAKAEYDALPAGAVLRRFIDDYGTERDKLRACRATP